MNLSAVPQHVVDRVRREFIPSQWGEACVLWQLSPGNHGYGQIGWDTKADGHGLILAHRLSYLMFHGDIPDDLTVDHICHVRMCWNPRHLRLKPNEENAADNGMKTRTHCPQGHPYEGANLRIDRRGHRFCRTCQVMWGRGWRKSDGIVPEMDGVLQRFIEKESEWQRTR